MSWAVSSASASKWGHVLRNIAAIYVGLLYNDVAKS